MKNAATFAAGAWLLLVIGVVAWLGNHAGQRLAFPAEPVVSQEAEAELAKLRAGLVELNAIQLALKAPVVQGPLIALAPAQTAPETPAQPNAVEPSFFASKPVQTYARSVSLVYISAGFRRAVIDGVYVKPGSVLPGNARVLDVQRDAVVISEAGKRRVLKVDNRANAVGSVSGTGS